MLKNGDLNICCYNILRFAAQKRINGRKTRGEKGIGRVNVIMSESKATFGRREQNFRLQHKIQFAAAEAEILFRFKQNASFIVVR